MKLNRDYIDLAVANMLLPQASPEQQAFLSYLSLASRKGHLCVQIKEGELLPDPQMLDMQISKEIIYQGAVALPPLRGICKEGDRFYFERYWALEKRCFGKFQNLLDATPEQRVEIELHSLDQLLPEQAEAILRASRRSLTLLCGGPGTGKTYTIRHLLRALGEGKQVALAAPTGKAAVHLEKTIGNPQLKAATLHALLGLRQKNPISCLEADLIVVDECSMIDLKVMNSLLEAVKPGARLVLVGDPHQLSPVESGSLFSDLSAYCSSLSDPEKHPVELKRCLRADLEGIVHLAEAIKAGNEAPILQNRWEGVSYFQIQNEEATAKEIAKTVAGRFVGEPEALLEPSFRLLSPLRKGPLGVDSLNCSCARLNFCKAVPIILTASNWNLKLFNGETGVLVESEGYALFPSHEKPRRIPALLLPAYEYAYCLSVHKSQGSEFDSVWVVLPKGSEVFGRELLYTAATRARKSVQLFSAKETLVATLKRQGVRLSGIC